MNHTASLLLAVTVLTASSASGNVVNRVTVAGKIVRASQATTVTRGATTTTTSKLVSQSITNSSILDALVAGDDIPDKRGYSIVELFDDAGVSQGLFARNAKTGDTVEIDSSLISAPADSNLVVAETSSEKVKGDVTTETHSSAFTGVATCNYMATPLASFVNGTTASKSKTLRIDGAATAFPYIATSYTAVSQGVSVDSQLISTKLTSTGSAFEAGE